MKYLYVVNRFNLKDRCDTVIENLRRVSEEFRRDYEILLNETPEEAKEKASIFRESECVVTAVGGDGTINLLLNDLVGTRNILSVVPVGTGNDFYRTMTEVMKSGIREVDLIRVNGRYAINAVCFGIDADIANDERFIHNRFIPKPLRFHAGVLYHFATFKKGRHLKVECEGQTIEQEFLTVVASNGRYYGGGYCISPDSEIGDGRMEICLADGMKRLKAASVLLSMKDAGHLSNPAIHRYSTTKMTLTADEPFEANIDGEPLLSDRFELEMVPGGILLEHDPEFLRRMR
ncbi:MAG: hypothetical protein K6F53_10610 [Lachnospiraceae bacterium]|nr:hypothetical protein [Lachnospiraceae bacterium]